MKKLLFIVITITIVNAQGFGNLFLNDWQMSFTTSFIETGSLSIHKKIYEVKFDKMEINFVAGPNLFLGNLGSKKDLYFEYDLLSRFSYNLAEKIEIGSDVGISYRYIADGYDTHDGIKPKIGLYAGYNINEDFMVLTEVKGMWVRHSDFLSLSSAGIGVRWSL